MTKLWIDWKYEPVTLLKLVPQEIINYKTEVRDWYDAIVVGVEKKQLDKDKWQKIKYKKITEFKVDSSLFENFELWKVLDTSLIDWVNSVCIKWTTKWKWFQGTVKRYWFATWPKTHGSHFHRKPGSIWSMKPRRVIKWKKMPWNMWNVSAFLKNVNIVDKIDLDDESLVAVKWSIPWFYWSLVKMEIR